MSDLTAAIGRLEREMPGLLDEHGIPGMAVGLCDASGVRWSRGYGVTRTGGSHAVTTETMFSVQSCSKMYTAATVLLAVQQGLLDLDAPIVDYLPDFTVHSTFETHPERRMTLRHLLSHTAGFTHEAPVGGNFLVGGASFTAHCCSIADTWLRFPVGHHYEYSNLGIDLAAYAVQRVSGLRFERFAQRHLLEPLGLTRATFDQRVIAADTNRAIGHSSGRPARSVRVPMIASGGLYVSIDDACRYVAAHLSAEVADLRPDLVDQLYRVPFPAPGQTHGYGLGTIMVETDGVQLRGHSGGGFGFLSDMYWAPSAGLGMVLLTNSTGHPLQWSYVTGLLADLTGRVTPASPAPPSAVDVSTNRRGAISGPYAGRFDEVRLTATTTPASLTRNGKDEPAVLVGPDEFVLLEGAPERFRLLDDDATGRPQYLQAVRDGTTWYRADAPGTAAGEPDGPWNRSYAIRVSGRTEVRLDLRRDGDTVVLIDWHERTLRLDRVDDGHYLSVTGEMLDLTRDPITYANIRLHPAPVTGNALDRPA